MARGTQGPAPKVGELVAQLPVAFPLTSLDKVLYPDAGITKAQLIAYLAVVADRMLPHVAGRPLALLRCPDGAAKPCFYQRHALRGAPPALHALDEAMAIDSADGLIAIAQLGGLEIHTWGCRTTAIEQPDLLVFDLDPDVDLPWEQVALGAFDVRRALSELGLASFVKTTGGKGLHVVAPIEPRATWDDVKAFTKAIAERLAAAQSDRYTAHMAKAKRRGRIFVDYLRNARGATFIAPYSMRALPGAPVATPVSWEELAAGVDATSFTIATLPARLASLARDPWSELLTTKQHIGAAASPTRRARKTS